MSLRLGLLAPVGAGPWRRYNLLAGFAAIARQARDAGWTAELLQPPTLSDAPDAHDGPELTRLRFEGPPIVAGPSAALTASLRSGYALIDPLRERAFDVIVAPLKGGLAQPLLMSRAAGEGFEAAAVVLWGEASTRRRVRLDSEALAGPTALVDDALERTALRLADAVACPPGAALDPGERPHRLDLVLPAAATAESDAVSTEEPSEGLAFIGPGSDLYGAGRFLRAVEMLAERGELPRGGISFYGPWRETAAGLCKSVLGLRARRWDFPFRLVEAAPDAVPALVAARRETAVFLGEAADDDVLLQRMLAAGAPVRLAAGHRMAASCPGVPLLPAAWPDEPAAASAAPPPDSDWPSALAALREARGRTPARAWRRPSVSVCILHRDRPDLLRRAVASIGGPSAGLEIIVTDNGSHRREVGPLLDGLEGQGVRVLRRNRNLSQGRACNLAAAAATGETLVFLDDDNAFIDAGWRRMAAACERFDIVVTTLAVVDGEAETVSVRHCFLGDAGSAGLFFNGFGDSNLAIRRSAFERIGGFPDDGGPTPDWIMLAKARAAGLSIGVLAEPAVAYRRRLGDPTPDWRKYDQDGARRAVLEAYAGEFDGELVARVATGLHPAPSL